MLVLGAGTNDHLRAPLAAMLGLVVHARRFAVRTANEKRGFALRAARPMAILARLHMMLGRRELRACRWSKRTASTVQGISLLMSGKVRGLRFETPARIREVPDGQPADLLERVPDDAA